LLQFHCSFFLRRNPTNTDLLVWSVPSESAVAELSIEWVGDFSDSFRGDKYSSVTVPEVVIEAAGEEMQIMLSGWWVLSGKWQSDQFLFSICFFRRLQPPQHNFLVTYHGSCPWVVALLIAESADVIGLDLWSEIFLLKIKPLFQ